MKTKRNFSVVLTTILAIAAFSAVAWAGPPTPRTKPPACSLVGTWAGSVDEASWPSALNWTSVVTADASGKSGEIVLSWVPSSENLYYLFGTQNGLMEFKSGHLNPGHGVWQLTDGVYNYTWYAYYVAVDPTGASADQVIYSVRAFGTVDFPVDCNHETMTYTFEGFVGLVAPQDMSETNPNLNFVTSSTYYNQSVYETKVPLVVSTTP